MVGLLVVGAASAAAATPVATTTTVTVSPTTVGPRATVTVSVAVTPAPPADSIVDLTFFRSAEWNPGEILRLNSAGTVTRDYDTTNWPTGGYEVRAAFRGTEAFAPSTGSGGTLTITAPNGPPPALTDHRMVDESDGDACAIDFHGRLSCWGRDMWDDFQIASPEARFRSVSSDCAVTTAGEMVCWETPFRASRRPMPDGTYLEVSGDCGLRTDHTLACRGQHHNLAGDEQPPFGTFRTFSWAYTGSCGIRFDDSLTCWGEIASRATAPAGSFVDVSVGGGFACALRSDATLACWGAATWPAGSAPAGQFKAVDAGTHAACAIRLDGSLVCWGNTTEGLPTSAPGPYREVAVGDYTACVRDANEGIVSCWPNLRHRSWLLEGGFAGTAPPQAHAGFPFTWRLTTNITPRPAFSMVSGSLPPGLTLSTDGVISGTPTAGGVWTDIVIRARNGVAPEVFRTLDLEIGVLAVTPAAAPAINGGAASTASPNVTVAVAASGAVAVGLSNDGVAWSVRPYAASVPWTLPATDGPRTVYIRWRDGAGNWTTPTSDSIVLDRSAPTVTAPTPTFSPGTTLVAGVVPTRLLWSASDSLSSVVRYELRQFGSDGVWRTVNANLSRPSATLDLASGRSYRFAVRGFDAAGNASGYAVAQTFPLTALQETSAAVRYVGSWGTAYGSSYMDGRTRYATSAGARAILTFSGRSVGLVSTMAPTRGRAAIYVDGALATTIDLRSSTWKSQTTVWSRSWATAGRHTVEVRVLGTAGRPRVDVDGWVVAG